MSTDVQEKNQNLPEQENQIIPYIPLNYLQNIEVKPNDTVLNNLPENIKQIILLPFIFIFNFLGTLFGGFLPKDQTSYFNNIFILEKIE